MSTLALALALAGCARDLRVLDELVYQSTDPTSGLSEDLHVEGLDARVRDVSSECTLGLSTGDLRAVYARAAPLFSGPVDGDLGGTGQAWRLHLVDIDGEELDVTWRGDLDPDADADLRAVDDLTGVLDPLWARVLAEGACGDAPFL